MSITYTFMRESEEDGGDLVECASCGYPAPLYPFERALPRTNTSLLCKLCASTSAGSAEQYPGQYTDGGACMKTTCYVGNSILAKLGAFDAAETVPAPPNEDDS